MVLAVLQTALRAVYPPECLLCREIVETEFGLCGPCWGKTPFLGGALCDVCGSQQPGVPEEGIVCDDCVARPKSWSRGRAALGYGENARDLVLALKHGDRQDIARPAGQWMARAAAPLMRSDMLIAPVPLHWTRLAKRRYNQSALLAKAMADHLGCAICPDLLQRYRRTESLQGKDYEARRDIIRNTIRVNPRRRTRIAGGRPVLLVDDVLTSGATLNACAEALTASRAGEVSVIVLARAVRGD
ncbi:ComF family protein [Roseobacteraceae bacterium S113]